MNFKKLKEAIRHISIHALREEGDLWFMASFVPLLLFLSTPSARRATVSCGQVSSCLFISIHALREEGDACEFFVVFLYLISIHALREEGDWQHP